MTSVIKADVIQKVDGSAFPFGKVMQVQSTVITSQITTAAATWQDTGLSITITPSSVNSSFFIMFDASVASSAPAGGMITRIVRDTTELMYAPVAYTSGTQSHYVHASVGHLDSPASTSPITYKIQYTCQTAGYTAYFNGNYSGYPNPTANMTVIEIAG